MATKQHRIVATRLPDTLHAWLEARLRDYRTKLTRLGIAAKVTRSDIVRSCIAEAMEREPGGCAAEGASGSEALSRTDHGVRE